LFVKELGGDAQASDGLIAYGQNGQQGVEAHQRVIAKLKHDDDDYCWSGERRVACYQAQRPDVWKPHVPLCHGSNISALEAEPRDSVSVFLCPDDQTINCLHLARKQMLITTNAETSAILAVPDTRYWKTFMATTTFLQAVGANALMLDIHHLLSLGRPMASCRATSFATSCGTSY
jgi:hypothetical protein